MKMTLKLQSSIGSKLFKNVEKMIKFLKISKFSKIIKIEKEIRKEKKKIREAGRTPALRVIRAETRLTVYRSLPYSWPCKTCFQM